MRQLIRVLTLAALAGAVAIGLPGTARAQDDESPCAVCHDDIAASFTLTPHGMKRQDAPRCETCHGDGTAHMDEGDPALINIPKGADGAAMCMKCHGGTHDAFTAGEVHTRSGIYCESCHNVHPKDTAAPKLLVSHSTTELCSTCHARQARTFSRPFGHELGRAGLDCVSCHNPHGGPGERSLKVDRSGDMVCFSCHADKRGPKVFPHVSDEVGGCLNCHQPHGSSNPNALKRSRADQLCLECHSQIGDSGTLGSIPPATHDLRSPRYRDCTVCHTAVHGSNTSPRLLK